MSMAKFVGTMCLIGYFALISPVALAADMGWYGGVNAGQSRTNIDDTRINTELQSAGFATAVTAKDERDTAFKLFLGHRFNRNFAVEGGYFDLGQSSYTTTTTGPAGTLTGSMKRQGVNLDAVGIAPITDKFSALGRLGLIYAESKDAFASTGGVSVPIPNATKRAANYKVGLGLQYDLSGSIGLRGEIERYQVEDSAGNRGAVDFYSAGMVVKF